ncbi:hypothetical protein [Lachnoclostridium phytofermentans]|uniref:hypothetical protein n=1 Tax=Lachnoclostridium phytofermentans TaxID=66219 RepID=UPI0004965476|nr:hypothetical protein [Lachnoclostridium phytofermentans]
MPHINRIRVNNVKYNFGTQAYDDFIMKPFCHNTLYDLANGGGKSVLMLLMLQNMIPNCTLDEKQPIEKLFRTGDGSQTIHSLIEWRLDDFDTENGFRYMLTGFCARKATNQVPEEVKDTASIEYFNYCIFYREYNENDIKNLPLVKDKERITYTGLRKYLKDLERDNNYVVKIFDRKKDYQAFVSLYGIYESEWEIIRGINKTEGHVRTYFETNYKTTRKVVEDLLIEEIIQKSFTQKAGSTEEEETMSKTLLDIREKLLELSRCKDEIANYDRQIEVLQNFSKRLEGLVDLYQEKEQYEEDLAKVYRKASDMTKESKDRFESLEEEVRESEKKREELKKRLENIRVFETKRETIALRARLEKAEEEYQSLTEKLQMNQAQLMKKESMNDYLEYLNEKQKRNEVLESIRAVQSNNSDLLSEIQSLVYEKKKRFDAYKTESVCLLESLALEIAALQKALELANERVLSGEKEYAVVTHQLQVLKDKRQELGEKITGLLREANLLLLEESEKQKQTSETRLHALTEKKKVTEEKKLLEEALYQEAIINVAKLTLQSSTHKEHLEEEEKQIEKITAERNKIEQLLRAYGQDELNELKQEIHRRLRKIIPAIAFEKELILKLKKEKEDLESGRFSGNEEVLQLAATTLKSRFGIDAMTGVEYLHTLDTKKRSELILNLPYLPYAVILRGEESTEEINLTGKEFEEYVIPVIQEQSLDRVDKLSLPKGISLLSKDQSVLFDESRLKKEINKLEDEIKESKSRIYRLEDQEKTYSEDEEKVSFFQGNGQETYTLLMESAKNRKQKLEEVDTKLRKKREECEERKEQIEALGQLVSELQKDIESTREEIRLLHELNLLKKEFTSCESEIASEENRKQKIKDLLSQASEEKITLTEKGKELESVRASNKEALNKQVLLWESKYQLYYKEGEYKALSLTEEELTTKLHGCLSALESKHSDLEDKNRLVNSYVNAMNRCLKSIQARSISLTLLEQMQQENRLFETSDSEISSLKETCNNLEQETGEKKVICDSLRSDYSRLLGKCDQAVSALNEQYGEGPFESFEGFDLERLTIDTKEQLNRLEVEAKKYQGVLESCKKEEALFEEMKKDVERMRKNVDTSLFTEVDSDSNRVKYTGLSTEEVLSELKKLESQFEENEKRVKQKQEEFAHNKGKTMDSLKLLGAVMLADEISQNVKLPYSEADTRRLITNLHEVNDCLALEKERIYKGIEDMQNIKDNFENQCLQRCVYIKTELERLPKLSRITLEGELIPMISLHIPYVKEEFYKDKMSSYIDEIVKGADAMKDLTERLKFIRNALSLKKLFSVIVTDMNAIKLSLYKRERIKEQSRHLRYEEAVGSTGQSQGIYTQFLISIINYITNINSHKAENSGLRKVIFIDNPFGAAKDVYIWEPIFELLKANQVQLIVPARGTTPAITSRFDVNYVLGQKLIDQRQQTVVVDYHSSVEARETEFTPLRYEQTSFDFYQ